MVRRQRDTQTIARWLIHLVLHHRHLGFALQVDNPGLLHFVIEVVAHVCSLTNTGKDR